MGFGFNIFLFPILILGSIALLLYFVITSNKLILKILALGWTLIIALVIFVSVSNHLSKPISLIKENVIGEYRIDKDFYPGVNAEWQFAHYKFFITKEDEIIFICMNDKGNTRKIFKHKISYIDGPPALWKIQSDSTHHIIQNQPTLYRSHNDFYYVFNSTKYGNMFFRKSDD